MNYSRWVPIEQAHFEVHGCFRRVLEADRLTQAHRGNLDQNHAIPAANRDYGEIWTLSPTGNWSTYKSLSE